MNKDTREIESITLGIYSPEEIQNMSVCKIDSAKKTGPGTVYDPRMGTTDSSEQCETCKEGAAECHGHFGHIEFNEPIVHPLFYKRVESFLRCFCLKCYRLLITKDQIMLCGLNKYKGKRRFAQILEKLKKVDICCQPSGEVDSEGEAIICGKDQPTIKFTAADSSMSMVYEDRKKDKTSIVLTTEEIKKAFDSILDEDVKLLGFDPTLSHPRNFIISMLPVLPPCDRPYVKADGKMCDDDLTIQYIEIIKANNHLADKDDDSAKKKPRRGKKSKESGETARQRALASLRFRVLTTFNNSQGKAKHTTNGRPIKGFKERLTGKDGQIRNNMMGKRSVRPDTPVLMFKTGKTKRADEIVVGDVVVGDDGSSRTVIDTVSGESPLYIVKQSHGDNYGISCEHILTLKYCGHAKIHWRPNQSALGGYSIMWYDRSTKKVKSKKINVVTSVSKNDTENMMGNFLEENNFIGMKYNWCPKRKRAGTWRVCYSLEGKKKSKEFAIVPGRTKKECLDEMEMFKKTINSNPIVDMHVKDYLQLPKTHRRCMLGIKLGVPVQWVEQKVPIDPRILGMWLGDGGTNRATFTNPDKPLIEYFKEWTEKQGGKFHTQEDELHHGISYCDFLGLLRKNNLYNNKHIPEEYIINSEDVRLKVLAGLIDTDGSVEQEGKTVRIIQCYKHKDIIYGAQRIARSLGFCASVHEKKTSWESQGECKKGVALELTISGAGIEKIPTLLPRKKCAPPNGTDMCSTKIEIVEDGVGKFCGFEVDKNNRFLLGDYTITHNCDFTGRTVIGPEPTLRMGQLAVPVEMAEILTIPVRVAAFNINDLQKIVDSGVVKTLLKPDGKTNINLKRFLRGTRLMNGDIIHRGDEKIEVSDGKELVTEGDKVERGGEFLDKLFPANRKYKLFPGWTVNRPLQNGDYVLLNRQPTLHKASMMAMEVVIMKYKTLRMNLAITKPFNADFDGDEMNLHVPQSLEAQAELKMLSAAQFNIISAQSSKPNMAIVQDSLLGAYRMTKMGQKLSKAQFYNIAIKMPRAPWSEAKDESPDEMMTMSEILGRIQHTRRILKEKGKKIQCFNGRGLVSLFLPKDFNYEKHNEGHPDEPVVKIWRGVMYEGALNKSTLGAAHNSLIHVIYKEYGPAAAAHFIDCIQFSTNNFLLVHGFSVGLGDCLIPQTVNEHGVTKEQEITDVIHKCYIEAEGIKTTTTHKGIRETRINAALNKAKDIGLRIAKEALASDNNFLDTVNSGSKGDYFNIAQITGLLGQQNLKGSRVPLSLNHGRRSLPHYPFKDLTPEMEYESRGFIDRGFLRGLTPRQFYFHAMSGREGICDTAMGTATSGYMQRRIIKLTEDIKIQNDGTVRDIPGQIYQVAFGETGIDPTCTVKVKGQQEMCDISRLVSKLNMKHELKKKLPHVR